MSDGLIKNATVLYLQVLPHVGTLGESLVTLTQTNTRQLSQSSSDERLHTNNAMPRSVDPFITVRIYVDLSSLQE